MTKAAIIISAILVFAGIAAAGTLSSSGKSDTPTIQSPTLPATTTTTDDAQGAEDVSGPCDEAEHANDPRCGGAGAATAQADDHGVDDSGPHGQSSGHGDDDGSSGHGGDDSGLGGGNDD